MRGFYTLEQGRSAYDLTSYWSRARSCDLGKKGESLECCLILTVHICVQAFTSVTPSTSLSQPFPNMCTSAGSTSRRSGVNPRKEERVGPNPMLWKVALPLLPFSLWSTRWIECQRDGNDLDPWKAKWTRTSTSLYLWMKKGHVLTWLTQGKPVWQPCKLKRLRVSTKDGLKFKTFH